MGNHFKGTYRAKSTFYGVAIESRYTDKGHSEPERFANLGIRKYEMHETKRGKNGQPTLGQRDSYE